jgi:hypothetical protein
LFSILDQISVIDTVGGGFGKQSDLRILTSALASSLSFF